MLSLSAVLFAKEWRELLASRSWWLMLLAIGPLTGQGFISAINLYSEASGIGGGPAALPQGLTPLDGVLVPTFGAYELAVTLLLPFIAIRLLAAEKESGAWKLALQFPASTGAMIAAKISALMAGWLLAWLAGILAVVLWKTYGGHLYWPETLNLWLGHWLRMLLSGGVAVLAAALAESAASAAIVTLSFTIGTWALDFIATGRGGWLAAVASYTPTSALRFFERGLFSLNVVLVMLALSVGAFAVAAVWVQSGRSLRNRIWQALFLVLVSAGVVLLCSGARASFDLSEDRRNSFPRADEAALSKIREPLNISINLAAEDPRLMDYERSILTKLKRVLPKLNVEFEAQSRTGLFEEQEDHYGEIWYDLGGRKMMSRSTTVPIVLEELYQLAQLNPPEPVDEPDFPGYPLAATPRGAKIIFYIVWPVAVLTTWWLTRYHWR